MRDLCIVGCGQIASMYAKNLRGRARLWYYSRSKGSAERMCAKHSGSGVLGTLKEATDRCEALVICSPPEAHTEQALAALVAGRHVLVEKPLCVEERELATIERAIAAAPTCMFMVGENYYYKPSLTKIRELLEQGHLGKIRKLTVRRMFQNQVQDWRLRYGALIEGGIHYVALISAIMGEQPSAVSANFPMRDGGPERISSLALSYPDGRKAELHYSWITRSLPHGFFQTSTIEGEKGKIQFESNGLYVRIDSPGLSRTFFPSLGDFLGQKAMISDLLACIESSRKPVSDFARAKADLAVVFEAYRQLN